MKWNKCHDTEYTALVQIDIHYIFIFILAMKIIFMFESKKNHHFIKFFFWRQCNETIMNPKKVYSNYANFYIHVLFTTKVSTIPYIWFPLGISLVNWFWYTLKGNWRYFMTLRRKCNTFLLFLLLHCRLFLSASTTFFYRIRLFFLPILFSWGKKQREEISTTTVFIFIKTFTFLTKNEIKLVQKL